MNAIEIQDVWQAIRESERSDESQFMDEQLLITTSAARLAQPRSDQSGEVQGIGSSAWIFEKPGHGGAV